MELDASEQVQKIKDYLKYPHRHDKKFLPRPFFIEITGTPSSGKTTAITELNKFFKRKGFRVISIQEGAEAIRHVSRDTPLYNLRTAIYALNQLIDLSHSHLYDFVIFDRALFDAFVWMMYWEEKGKLTQEEKEAYQEFFKFRLWIKEIDSALFITCDPEEAMRRELRLSLTDEEGEYTNPKTIATLITRYDKAYETLKEKHEQLHYVDSTNLNEKELVMAVLEICLIDINKKVVNNYGNRNMGAIHKYLKTDIRHNEKYLPRPFFIEISGTPSSGKTRLIEELDKFFRRNGLKVLCPQEGAQVIRHIPRSSPVYPARTALYATSLLIDLCQSHQYDVVIFDRCIFDPQCWLELFQENTEVNYKRDENLIKINNREKQVLQDFFLSRFWVTKIDLAIFALCDPETAVKRELKHAVIKKLGTATNHDTLTQFIKIHKNTFEKLNNAFPQLFILDTTNINRAKVALKVSGWAIEAFMKKVLQS